MPAFAIDGVSRFNYGFSAVPKTSRHQTRTMDPLPTKTLGQRVRELRQNADLALRDLGEKLKDPETGVPVSAAFLSDIENGRRFPSDELIDRIASVLGADASELRRCDPRGPAREIQDLAVMNARYAFAFRRAVDYVQDHNLSPEEFIRRVESDPANKPNQQQDR